MTESVSFQGGIGPAGLATDDLHVLDLTQAKPRWHRCDLPHHSPLTKNYARVSYPGGWGMEWLCRVVVQGPGPGPRYGHVMALVGQRFLLSISGNDGIGTHPLVRIPHSIFYVPGV